MGTPWRDHRSLVFKPSCGTGIQRRPTRWLAVGAAVASSAAVRRIAYVVITPLPMTRNQTCNLVADDRAASRTPPLRLRHTSSPNRDESAGRRRHRSGIPRLSCVGSVVDLRGLRATIHGGGVPELSNGATRARRSRHDASTSGSGFRCATNSRQRVGACLTSPLDAIVLAKGRGRRLSQ